MQTALLLQLRKECKRSFYSKGVARMCGVILPSVLFFMQLKDGSVYSEAEIYRCNI